MLKKIYLEDVGKPKNGFYRTHKQIVKQFKK